MNKSMAIVHYEYKMQMKRAGTWAILFITSVISMLDDYPSAGNLARLEFLNDPAYFVHRTMKFNGLILIFGLMFLLSGRVPFDRKTGVKALMMASPLGKGQYISGKLLGGFLYTFTMLTLFLVSNTLIYFVAAPFPVTVGSCLSPLFKTLVISALPVSFFVSLTSIAFSSVMDIRLFYLPASVLFIINAQTVSSAEPMPFYIITSGDLIKLIWQHPNWPVIYMKSVGLNLLFLVGTGLFSWLLALLNRKLWRAE